VLHGASQLCFPANPFASLLSVLQVYVWSSSSRKSHYIGAFPTPLEAARAYDVAVLWLMGQDVRPRTRLNFSLEDYKLDEIQAEAAAVAAMRQLSKGPLGSQPTAEAMEASPPPPPPAAAGLGSGGGGGSQHSFTGGSRGEGRGAAGPTLPRPPQASQVAHTRSC
jgi:hypothetical protein